MKKIPIVLLIVILGLLPVSLSQAATEGKDMSVITGINYNSWWDDQSPENSGYEFLLPVKFSYRQKTYSIDLITAYAKADYDGIDNSSISCLTDTSVKLKYTIPDLPVSLLLGMDFNIPTGKEKLASDEVKAEMDEDLVRLNNFGEGLNIGPSVSIAKQFGKIFMGVGTGYIWKGEYDPTDYPDDDTDPGDEIIISGNVIYLYSDSLELNGKLTYFWYDINEVDGADYFQIGETYQIGGGLKFKLAPYIIYASFLEILQDKNKEIDSNEVFGSEENNSNGDIFQLNFGLDYTYTTDLKLKGVIETKFVDSNGYDVNDDYYYDAGRTKYAFGPGAEYKINQNCTINGFLKYFILEDGKDASVAQDTTYQGIDFSVEVSYNF